MNSRVQIGDVELPHERHATLRVERTARFSADEDQYGPTKTDGYLADFLMRNKGFTRT